jgi:hypothetical protein
MTASNKPAGHDRASHPSAARNLERLDADNNNNIYLVRPPRGGWLHRSPRVRVAVCQPVPYGSLTPCKSVMICQ